MNQELYHYGVKGMKWGIRKSRRDKHGDYTIQKNSNLGRVALSTSDPVFDNKKYLSTNVKDQKKWEKYLGKGYLQRGRPTFNIGYKTVKDIKVLSSTHSGQKYAEMLMSDPDFANQSIRDMQKVRNMLRMDPIGRSPSEQLSLNIAAQTETGHKFVDRILKEGYSAIEDEHGKNVAKDPIIVFDPDKNLQRTSIDTTKYWRNRR